MSRKKLTVEETFPGLPNRIRFLRNELTQEEFDKIVGVSKATISKYESGIAIPSSNILRKIASIGNRGIDWLLRGDREVLFRLVELKGQPRAGHCRSRSA
jgi:transcriptional regulator with XRE-family HTH domain